MAQRGTGRRQNRLAPHEYIVISPLCKQADACCWRRGKVDSDEPRWTMAKWCDDHFVYASPLTEEGRRAIIGHFLLLEEQHHLPLEEIEHLSPADLLKRRRRVEKVLHSFHHCPMSEAMNDRILAELVS